MTSQIQTQVSSSLLASSPANGHLRSPGGRTCVKEFIDIAKVLSTQNSVKEIEKAFDDAARFRSQTHDREEEIQRLLKQVSSQKIEHEADVQRRDSEQRAQIQKIFAAYHESITNGEAQTKALKNRIEDSRLDLQNERVHSSEAKKKIQDLEFSVKKAENQLESERVKSVQIEEKSEALVKEVASKDEQLQEVKGNLRLEKQKVSQLEQSLSTLESEHSSTTKELQAKRKEIKKVKSYLVEMHRDSPDKFIGDLKQICESACKEIKLCFEENLSESVLNNKRAWSNFLEAAELKADFPLPPSNSQEAKNMRSAATLAVLARSINTHLFSSTYLLSNDTDMRRVLLLEAESDDEKEMLSRALLLSIQKSEQTQNAEERVSAVMNEVINVVQKLAPASVTEKLGSRLMPVVERTMRTWWRIQRCKSKLEADIDYNSIDGWEWGTLSFPSGPTTSVEEDDSSAEDAVLVVFPKVFLLSKVDSELTLEPIFPGVVLRQWQTEAAAEECENSRVPPAVHKPKHRRLLSASTQDRPTERGRFLGREES